MTPSALKSLLESVLANPRGGREVNALVRHAYHQALVRVKQLHYSGRLHLQQHPLSLESIAFDCIGELFARDADDVFVELEDGFSGPWSLQELDEAKAASRFRSLVFTYLHQGLIRTYREFDPVFSKILRNVRLSLRSMRGVHTYERLGLRFVSPVPSEQRREELPDLHFHALQRLAASLPAGTRTTRSFLERLLAEVASQSEFRRTAALFDVTLALKHHLVRERVPLESIATEEHSALHLDVASVVTERMEAINLRFHEEYVASGKLTEDLFRVYAVALRDLVNDVYVLNNGQDLAHPDYLMVHMPGLTRDEYRRDHRVYFEYMVKVARRAVGESLRELLG